MSRVSGEPVGAAVTLADVREQALSVDEALTAVRHPHAGGVATFVGVVRDHDHGHDVASLDYSAHPTAVDVLRRVAEDVAARHDVVRVAAVHRTGHLEVGDLAVVVAVSAAHRGAALEACRDLIDTLKGTVPIWKHQLFADGADEWVGMP
ncbi:molybdenum cofactor biosynthesis protein MoaE [Oryzihumus leptocrescens]|uniref:Molybdopterin synthase catalytic subunit 1 n=1 Tax=Oryzihumus leptocrescens TaxID=297536 RepID=A0A542ZMJ3_9MICO|nr:molybdenum cofactor biosynthesis protein MoaE [Oryzihumus leptocrescens]TQL61430.1 molybdopterin synthase catalytic subunit [Oryzihumus leptocrescens]